MHLGARGQRGGVGDVVGVRVLEVDPRVQLVHPGAGRCPQVLQLQRVAAGVAVLARAFGDAGVGGVPAVEGGVVLAAVQVGRQHQAVGRGYAQAALEQQRVGVPVIGIAVDDGAVVARLVAVAARVGDQAVEVARAACGREALVPGAVGRVVADLAAQVGGLAAHQVVLGGLGAKAHRAADATGRAPRRGGAGVDVHAREHFRVDEVTAHAEGVGADTAHIGARGGVGHLDAVHIHADAVALDAADVVARGARTVEAAAVAAGARGRARRGDQRLVAHHVGHAAGLLQRRAADGGGGARRALHGLGCIDHIDLGQRLGGSLCHQPGLIVRSLHMRLRLCPGAGRGQTDHGGLHGHGQQAVPEGRRAGGIAGEGEERRTRRRSHGGNRGKRVAG